MKLTLIIFSLSVLAALSLPAIKKLDSPPVPPGVRPAFQPRLRSESFQVPPPAMDRPAGTTAGTSPATAAAAVSLANVGMKYIGEEGQIQPRQIRLGSGATNGNFAVFICTDVFQFQWRAQPGTNYEVECSHDLKLWVPTDITWEGSGGLETWTARIDAPQNFFRIKATPKKPPAP